MKKIIVAFVFGLLLVGCSSAKSTQGVAPKLVVGKSLENMSLKDAKGEYHEIKSTTQKVVFAFTKAKGHECNDFFNTKKDDYLQKHHTLFVADISGAPSFIRSMFILPGIEKLKHRVLLLEDSSKAAPYEKGMDTEKIAVVTLKSGTITAIKNIDTVKELQESIEE